MKTGNQDHAHPDNYLMKRHKRVAILADFPWTYFDQGAQGRGAGQGATWLSQLAEKYCEVTDLEFHWVTLDRSRLFGRIESRKWRGQIFHKVPVGKASVDLTLSYIPSRLALQRILARIKPDLVHAWGTERSYPIICGWRGIPSILSMQGIMTEYLRIGSFEADNYWSKVASWETMFLKAAEIVTCESQWGIDKLGNVVSGLNTRQVEYGVHPSFYEIQWHPDTSNPYAIYSGSIDFRKGSDVLIDSMRLLANRGWRLKIAGDGPLRKQLENSGVEGIEWLGLLPWSELQKQLSQALCLVLPTRADTSPNVSKEARVIGLPVVTTPNGGQAGYIRHGWNGMIVQDLTAQNLANAMDHVMSDPSRATVMGANGHENDRAYFQPSETARRFLAAYRELL